MKLINKSILLSRKIAKANRIRVPRRLTKNRGKQLLKEGKCSLHKGRKLLYWMRTLTKVMGSTVMMRASYQTRNTNLYQSETILRAKDSTTNKLSIKSIKI